ncbi:hypothetical protein [Mesorhizobium sp. J428]|uniref:hypothetical protein n=1 Tax=Mesorhizobium sp. J428 TaxID=2898440 RepID=UPI0021518BBD|nr:hypothetical protein [Mesorhizobium sp. J428]MCR5859712.1 hypothetical protein [Mesorhizobium sp. J428]
MTWTPDIVMVRLIEAYMIVERLPAAQRPPTTSASAWPNARMFDSEGRAFEFERVDLTTNGGEAMRQIKEARREDIERAARKRVPAVAISLATEALRWPIDMIEDPRKRQCLIAYATCRARNVAWTKWLQARNRRAEKENAWLRLKTYRWNEQSCQRITDNLLKADVVLRLPWDCSMIQLEPKRQGETDKLASHVWMASDAKPQRLMPETPEPSIPTPHDNQTARAA